MYDAILLHGEMPYASHSCMTQHPRCKNFYDKKWNVLTRDGAIEASQCMRLRCDKTVFYMDRGWSSGMQAAEVFCKERKLNVKELEGKIPFITTEFINAIYI